MVVTSKEKDQHIVDLEKLFITIEANLEKCAMIIAMRSPTSVKEVQQLTG